MRRKGALSEGVTHAMRELQWPRCGVHGRRCRNSTVFLPHSPNAVADATAQIRNGVLQGSLLPPVADEGMSRVR